MPVQLAVVTTHPIQYYAPLFRRVAGHDGIDLKVFYGWTGSTEASYDPGFEQEVEWDLPLLEGYDHTFVPNEADEPGTHHFRGMINPSLPEEMEEWGADAVLLFGWGWQSHLRTLRHSSGRIPVFFRGDSTLIDETGGLRQWARRAGLWWVYRHVDHALYVGTHNRDYFEAHGLADDQLHWVPHAIDNGRFADPDGTKQEEAAEWRRELGIPPEAPTLVFAGKLSRKKAPVLLLRAFEQLDAVDAHLVVAGSGPLEDNLRERAAENVHFLGFQNQSRMPVVYRLGDVFVMPSRGPGETWGLAINEAMACGRAVVASTKVGGAPDLIEDGENGFLFESDDMDSLTSSLQRLVDDPDLRARMGEVSARRIDDWSLDLAAQRLVETVRAHVDGEPGVGAAQIPVDP
ncbi:glycosyltransferase family 4 protein [Salinibacter ruber]|uniref:glycosyltransferase family 4 protein n=1 Tax=Salinibacter ruber TaxID=146919 RepID=UPI00216A695C|nr:glycosyltransferase involved in cell wall biosynthesis [Salinibacter ruber]